MIRKTLMLAALTGTIYAGPIEELAFLKWMEGTWIHESEGTTVKMKSRWMDEGKSLERNFEIQMGAEPVRNMRQTVFWDPAKKEVRSWGFYSDGTFETGIWNEKDSRLEVRREITYPDGSRGKATNELALTDPKNCTWRSYKRSKGWTKLPEIPMTSLQKD